MVLTIIMASITRVAILWIAVVSIECASTSTFAATREEKAQNVSSNAVPRTNLDLIGWNKRFLFDKNCSLSEDLLKEIKSYQPVADKIMDELKKGQFKGEAYKELEKFLNIFGNRLTGTKNLEDAIDYMISLMKSWNLNVETEEVTVPLWARGREEATLMIRENRPGQMWKRVPIPVLGLGLSVGTPAEGVHADVLVVKDFDDLKAKAAQVPGKIVVFNVPFTTYGEVASYRTRGPAEVGKLNGSAVLVRSLTPKSLNTLHTGMTGYDENPVYKRIPAAAITVEDAIKMDRLQRAGMRMYMHLTLNDYAPSPGFAKSRNTIGRIDGKSNPDHYVFVSGHIDSWDVGEGAMDDGGGMMISAFALNVLKKLKLQAKRSMKAVLFTGEEFGLIGGKAFYDKRVNELNKINAAIESDIGTFMPIGLDFRGNQKAACIVAEVAKLLAPIGADGFRKLDDVGSDIDYLESANVPSLSLNNKNERYFWYHHSNADYLSVYTPEDLDLSTAVFAVASYVLADLSVDLPRSNDTHI